jgi:hypothetical protein
MVLLMPDSLALSDAVDQDRTDRLSLTKAMQSLFLNGLAGIFSDVETAFTGTLVQKCAPISGEAALCLLSGSDFRPSGCHICPRASKGCYILALLQLHRSGSIVPT